MNDFGWNFPGKALFQKFQFSLSKTGNFKVLVRISEAPIILLLLQYHIQFLVPGRMSLLSEVAEVLNTKSLLVPVFRLML